MNALETKPVLIFLGAILATGCGDCSGPTVKPPGEQSLGSYALHATGSMKNCGLAFDPTYEQTLTLSRNADGGATFFQIDSDQVFDGGFDGQIAQYVFTGTAGFSLPDAGNCNQCKETVTLSLKLALLSAAQSKALGDQCPNNPLDGGVSGIGVDGGDVRPMLLSDGGFDAVRVCGEAQDVVSGEGAGFFCDNACAMCTVTYRIIGERK